MSEISAKLKIPEVLDGESSFALMMVKPHASKEVATPVILDFLEDPERYSSILNLDIRTTQILKDVKVVTHFDRDLKDERYTNVLNIFYDSEKNKPHYPIIVNQYTGPSTFILLSSNYDIKTFYSALQELKGKETLLSECGQVAQEGKGIRGVLINPRKTLDLNKLTEADIRTIVKNVVHIADEPTQVARALRTLINPNQIAETENKIPDLVNFLNKYAPTSIV